MTKKHIPVVGAAIIKNGKVLCTQRSTEGTLPDMWEFPGEKIEKGETKEQTLHREIGEELGVQVHILEYINENNMEKDWHFSNSSWMLDKTNRPSWGRLITILGEYN